MDADEIFRTLTRLEADGLQVSPRSHAGRALEAVKRSLALDRDELLMSARGSLLAALKGNDEAAVSDAVVKLSALSRDRQHFLDEIARVRRVLVDELKNVVLPLAFEHAKDRFNESGKKLMDALAACDATAKPDDVNAMSAEAVKAWGALSELNAACDKAAAMVRDALAISGSRVNLRKAEGLHALCLDGGDEALVRQVMSWHPPDPSLPNAPKPSRLDRLMTSRAGKWGAIYLYADAGLRCTLDEPADYTTRVKERAQLVKAQAAQAAKAAEDAKVVGSHG